MIRTHAVDYKYKYHKYLTRYLSRITAASAGTVIQQQLLEFKDRIKLEVLTPVLVEQVADFFELAVKWSYDTEQMHILEDTLMMRFVEDVADDQYDSETARAVAKGIKGINDKGYHKWFS